MADEAAALIERGLERAAEEIGDLTGPAMAEFYRRVPDARASFIHHALGDPQYLEAEMIGNTLYCIMRWHEARAEIALILDTSVPRHNLTLDVPPDWYRAMIEVTLDLIVDRVPAHETAERAAWADLRNGLVDLVERNRDA